MSTTDNSPNQEASIPKEGNKFALVMGVNNSSTMLPHRSALRYAEKDAEDMAYLLKQPECGFTLLVSPIIGEKATTSSIKQSVMNLSLKRTQQDFLLFYFAGHAAPVNNDIYFVTYDFQEDTIEATLEVDPDFYLSMRWLWKVLYQSTGAGRVLIILDCCYAGNMVEAQDDHLKIDLRRLLKEWDTGVNSKASYNCLRLTLTATGYNFQAQELDGHGFMTGLLLKALLGDVDEVLDTDGHVDIRMLHRYLQDKMAPEQRPDLSGKFGPYNCILASHPHRSARLRQQAKENEIKHEVERGILSELSRLYAETQHTQPFDHAVCHGASVADLDEEKITEFLTRERTQQDEASLPDESAREQLMHFGFLQKSFPTYGALLCFGQTPAKWVAGAITRCIDWSGNSSVDRMQDSREYRGSLLKQFELSLNFLKKKLRLSKVISREGREEQWEIPLAALEEALANALVHREYANRTDSVRVEVFDDRIEISSPGTLPPPMTEELLRAKHKSYPRNPQIAGIFYLYGYIEKLGTGIQRMQRFLKDASLPEPEFKLGEDKTFTVVLSRPKSISGPSRVDLREAYHIDRFYGRKAELSKLRQWIINDYCRIVAIVGLGGIGKSSLATKVTEQFKENFAYVFWRSLVNAPPPEQFLQSCLQFISDHQRADLPLDIDGQISLLIKYLRENRSLIVLDHIEIILQAGSYAGRYREGYEGYGKLLQRIGEADHKSCFLLVSREQPKEITHLQAMTAPVRLLKLSGLGVADGKKILKDRGLSGSNEVMETLIRSYSGNPLALLLIAGLINEVFSGDIAEFLKEGQTVFGDIYDLLEMHFNRLSGFEQEIMYWMAIEREPVSLNGLRENLIDIGRRRAVSDALVSLRSRSLIESDGATGFSLPPVLMEHITHKLVEQMYQEIDAGSIGILASHALIQAQAKEYIRNSQVRLILTPLKARLLTKLGQAGTEEKLGRILTKLREMDSQEQGYTAGNVLNLLIASGSDLQNYNFSSLKIRQAYLQDVDLRETNFAYADFEHPIFTDTFGSILSAAFSPDGEQLAAGTSNGEIRLWQTIGGIPQRVYLGHTQWVFSLAFSHDGTILASGSGDQTIRIWDMKAGKCLYVLRGHTAWVRSVAFSPDSKLLVSCGEDQTIRLWNVKTGQCLRTLYAYRSRVRSVAFSPNSTLIASGSEDATIRLWDAGTGKGLGTLRGHTKGVWSVAFHPDGATLVSGSEDQTIGLWDVKTRRRFGILRGHTDAVRSIAFSPDGTKLASCSEDTTIRLWNVKDSLCLQTLQGHTSWPRVVDFSPDGKLLVSGSEDQTVRLWEVSTGRCLKVLQGHTYHLRSIAYSPAGDKLVSCSEDKTVWLWDISSGRCIRVLRGHTSRVRTVAFNPNGGMVASGSDDCSIRLWDVSTGQCLRVLHDHTNSVRSVTFSPDGKLVASGSDDQTIRLWDISIGESRPLLGHSNRMRAVAFSPDGKLVASGSEDTTVQLWDASTGECLKTLHGHEKRVWAVAFSPDGKLVASGSEDTTVQLWDASTGECLKTLHGHTNLVWSVAFSPDSLVVASGGEDQVICLWRISDGNLLDKLQQDTTQKVRAVAFSPDGGSFASASSDGTIKLWNMQTRECLRTLSSKGPYEGMNITHVKGLTEAQKATLKVLGAIGNEKEKLF